MSLDLEEKVGATVKAAIKHAAPKFDEIQLVDVLYNEGGRWHTVELTWKEYLSVLQNGVITDGAITRNLVAICVNEVNVPLEDGSTEKIRMVYDFALKHTEKDPWRMS